jgi:hypothetical protein
LNPSVNIINREFLELQVPAKEEYLSYKYEIETLVNQLIPEKIEALYSSVFKEDETVRLNQLNIDLGVLPAENLTENLLQKFSSVFEKEMQQLKSRKEYRKEQNGSELELLKIFLLNGNLPWWVPGKAAVDLNIIFRNVLERNFKDLVVFLLNQPEPEAILRRIGNQFSLSALESFILLLVQKYFPGFYELLVKTKSLTELHSVSHAKSRSFIFTAASALLTVLREQNVSSAQKSYPEQKLLLKILNEFFVTNDLTPEDFYRGLIPGLTNDSKGSGKVNNELLLFFVRIVISFPEIREKYSGTILKLLEEQLRVHPSSKLEVIVESISDKKQAKINFSEKALTIIPVTEKLPDEVPELHSSKPSGIFIDNAGISLIAVYLPSFFKKVNLLQEGKFKNKESTERAALLINYITHKENTAYEFNLQLNKILCGIPVDKTIPKEFDVAEAEINEIDLLLQSVINNWTAIRNTSVDGLRKAFLQREGILYDDEISYRLRIERKSHDIILETLPWSVSVIRYNWMKKPVYVEW